MLIIYPTKIYFDCYFHSKILLGKHSHLKTLNVSPSKTVWQHKIKEYDRMSKIAPKVAKHLGYFVQR